MKMIYKLTIPIFLDIMKSRKIGILFMVLKFTMKNWEYCERKGVFYNGAENY